MKIEFIYTFIHRKQSVFLRDFKGSIMQNETALKKYAESFLKETDKKNLIKISSCIICKKKEDIKLPQWYINTNGKIYNQKNIEKIKDILNKL